MHITLICDSHIKPLNLHRTSYHIQKLHFKNYETTGAFGTVHHV